MSLVLVVQAKNSNNAMARSISIKRIHAVVGILKREGRYLIAERPQDKTYAGFWEFPGGKVEPNETGFIALQRELAEELGITVVAASFLFPFAYTYPDKHVHLEIWAVHEFSGEPQGCENQQLKWANRAEMRGLNLLAAMDPLLDQLE